MADISGYLNNIKSAESGETVRDSIIQCLNKINNDNPTTIKPLNVTANGTYSSETGFAYNPVTVNVPSGGASSYTFEELQVTENGEYEPEEENKMYNKVTVNVPQFAKDLAPDGFTITQNGEYDPLLDGYDGYGKIIVKVNEQTGEGPFTVQFYDATGTTVIQTTQVNKYGSASCTVYDGASYQGQVFKGWNPTPTSVTRDLKCYPQFGDVIIDPGEITDTWEQICAVRGAGYAIGKYKTLYFFVPGIDTSTPEGCAKVPSMIFHDKEMWPCAGPNNYRALQIADTTVVCQMMKVAEGEDGTTSTWLCKNATFVNNVTGAMAGGSNQYTWMEVPGRNDASAGKVSTATDWLNSTARLLLNNNFINAMPACLQATIKPVTKVSRCRVDYNNRESGVIFKTSSERIWLPSLKEMETFLHDTVGDQPTTGTSKEAWQTIIEPSGIDYTANWETIDLFNNSLASNEVLASIRSLNTYGNYSANAPMAMKVVYKGNDTWDVDINGEPLTKFIFGFCL